jgi:hypothetical protein
LARPGAYFFVKLHITVAAFRPMKDRPQTIDQHAAPASTNGHEPGAKGKRK